MSLGFFSDENKQMNVVSMWWIYLDGVEAKGFLINGHIGDKLYFYQHAAQTIRETHNW